MYDDLLEELNDPALKDAESSIEVFVSEEELQMFDLGDPALAEDHDD
ncbi:hypothetical protein [Neptuniibacter sp. QD37_11]